MAGKHAHSPLFRRLLEAKYEESIADLSRRTRMCGWREAADVPWGCTVSHHSPAHG